MSRVRCDLARVKAHLPVVFCSSPSSCVYSHPADAVTGSSRSVTHGSAAAMRNGRSVHASLDPMVTIEYPAIHNNGASPGTILTIDDASFEDTSSIGLVVGDFMQAQMHIQDTRMEE